MGKFEVLFKKKSGTDSDGRGLSRVRHVTFEIQGHIVVVNVHSLLIEDHVQGLLRRRLLLLLLETLRRRQVLLDLLMVLLLARVGRCRKVVALYDLFEILE
jgi:hypothetical protein